MAKGYMFGIQVPPDMTERQAVETAAYIKDAGGSLKFGIPKGVYRTATSNGNPEVVAAIDDVVDASGMRIIAGSMLNTMSFWGVRGTIPVQTYTQCDDVFEYKQSDLVCVRFPVGYYRPNAEAYPPTVTIKRADLARAIGLTSSKIVKGQTILGITGTG